jgi:hypothetical protein
MVAVIDFTLLAQVLFLAGASAASHIARTGRAREHSRSRESAALDLAKCLRPLVPILEFSQECGSRPEPETTFPNSAHGIVLPE